MEESKENDSMFGRHLSIDDEITAPPNLRFSNAHNFFGLLELQVLCSNIWFDLF